MDEMDVYNGAVGALKNFCEVQDARGIPRETQKGFILAVFENQGGPWS